MTDQTQGAKPVPNAEEAEALRRNMGVELEAIEAWLKSIAANGEATSRSQYRARRALENCREIHDALDDMGDSVQGIRRDTG